MGVLGEPPSPLPLCRGKQGDPTTAAKLPAATLAALRPRDQTNEAQLVEVTLQGTGMWTLAGDLRAALVRADPLATRGRARPWRAEWPAAWLKGRAYDAARGDARTPTPASAGRERLSQSFDRCPVHVTVRVGANLPSLRDGRFVREFRRSLAEACERGDFRVNHYSLQGDHAHFIIEANGKESVAAGMKSIGGRLARALNRVLGRSGPVLDGRYHHRLLRTPRELRRALAYVLTNARRHLAKAGRATRAAFRLDPASSARWFDGWRPDVANCMRDLDRRCEVTRPRTWLLRVGWRRDGSKGRQRVIHLVDESDCERVKAGLDDPQQLSTILTWQQLAGLQIRFAEDAVEDRRRHDWYMQGYAAWWNAHR